MGDRRLTEPALAMAQTIANLRNAQRQGFNRQRWPGAIQRTVTEGTGAATTNGTQVSLGAVNLEPGTWFVIARAGVSISSTSGAPVFTGAEAFTARLELLERDSLTVLEVLDQEIWAPAVDSYVGANVAYSQATILIGSLTYDVQTTVKITASSDEPVGADHVVGWRGGKIIALPF